MVAETDPRFERILYEKKGHSLWITINRPEVRNAQDALTREEISRALEGRQEF